MEFKYHENGVEAFNPMLNIAYHYNGGIAYDELSKSTYHDNKIKAYDAHLKQVYHKNGTIAYDSLTKNAYHENKVIAYDGLLKQFYDTNGFKSNAYSFSISLGKGIKLNILPTLKIEVYGTIIN